MTQEETPVQTFVELGLTYLQAKVYVTLVKLGQFGADVRKISQASNIARQDVYRVLPDLQKVGIVEKIIANPTMFKPVPLENGLNVMMQKKTEEFKDLQNKAKLMLDNFNINRQGDHSEDTSRFVITSERKLFFRKVREDIAETKVSIDIIYGKERMTTFTFYTIEELRKALQRRVKIRALTNKTGKTVDRHIQSLMDDQSFEVKFLPDNVPVGLVIFDNKEVNIRTADKIVPSLWTNNHNVLRLSQIYFDSMWK
jgi:sugar-specific transcriptional regulator TrmB